MKINFFSGFAFKVYICIYTLKCKYIYIYIYIFFFFPQLSPLTFFSFSFHIKRLADYIILFRKSMIAKTSLDSVTTVWGKNPGISSILDFSSEHLVSLFVKCKDEKMLFKISFSSKILIIPISGTYLMFTILSLLVFTLSTTCYWQQNCWFEMSSLLQTGKTARRHWHSYQV